MNKALLLSAFALWLSGCGSSPPTKFYVLSNVSTAKPMPQSLGRDIAVGVGPVVLPDYLDRPQIVTRSGQNELNLAEFDRWAEPLKDNVSQVLAENLAVLLPSNKVHGFPWKRATPLDCQVRAKITRFDHSDDGTTALHVRWSVLNAEGAEEWLAQESRYSEHPDGPGFAQTVAAMNRALAKFSRDVAQAVGSQAVSHIANP